MSLTGSEKQKIAEQEAYRAKVREQEDYRQQISPAPQKKSGSLGKMIIIILLLIFVPAVISVMYDRKKQEKNEFVPTSSQTTVIGKHAYNKTNGIYRGQILEEKSCATTPNQQCYVLKTENSVKKMEAPTSNILVKDTPPQP